MAKYLDENGVSYFWSKVIEEISRAVRSKNTIEYIKQNWGNISTLEGTYAYVEGELTTASGWASHAEGSGTKASGNYSHAEGAGTEASGQYSHAEGRNTIASEEYSHAEGLDTIASGSGSHAEGGHTEASGMYSHAEGIYTEASGKYSHAEGYSTLASEEGSHAEGDGTEASGMYSHAEGLDTIASGMYSHAGGWYTIASAAYQTAIGYFNVEYGGSSKIDKNENAIFIIGKGTNPRSRSNAFRVGETAVYGSTYKSSGADYAEFFEWLDGNLNSEDRVGRFVTLDGEKIRFASREDSFILGIVSGNPSIIGDSHDDQWKGMYMSDIYGRPIYEMVEVPAELDKDGNIIIEAHTESQQKINPDYDNSLTYESRSSRPEWAMVGMFGKLVVEDDGTCEVNGYCTPSENGIATISNDRTRYRVMSRIDEQHVKVLIL